MTTDNKWAQPTPVDEPTLAFGPSRISSLLPAWDTLPSNFRQDWHSNREPWCNEVSKWFFDGLSKDTTIEAKAGVDLSVALRHLSACLRSWEPKHEHKIAGVGYLMSLWFYQFGEAKHGG